jgi:hypothetical protein
MIVEVTIKFITVGLCVILLNSKEINAHGRLMDSVQIGSAWRKGFKTPENYNNHANFCGGL